MGYHTSNTNNRERQEKWFHCSNIHSTLRICTPSICCIRHRGYPETKRISSSVESCSIDIRFPRTHNSIGPSIIIRMNKIYTKQSKGTENLGYASLQRIETGISSPYALLEYHTATLISSLNNHKYSNLPIKMRFTFLTAIAFVGLSMATKTV